LLPRLPECLTVNIIAHSFNVDDCGMKRFVEFTVQFS